MCSNTLSSLAVFADFLTTHKPIVAIEMLNTASWFSVKYNNQYLKLDNVRPD